jgi:dTDP-4-dehydrorhamnose reductase
MNIFVTGGTEFIGKAFINRLIEELEPSDSVFILCEKKERFEDKRIVCLQGSLREIDYYKKELLMCHYVFHLAEIKEINNNPKEIFDKINYESTKKIVDILKKSNILKNFIYLSSIDVMNRTKNDNCKKPITKKNPLFSVSDYGISKIKSEEYILKNNIPYTIIRPCFLWGKNMKNLEPINRYVSLVLDNNYKIKYNYSGRFSLIHVENLADALIECINNKKCINKKYIAQTESISFGEIFRIIYYKIYKTKLLQRKIPLLKTIFSKYHFSSKIDFFKYHIDYYYAVDDDFKKDLLSGKNLISIKEKISDVINTNINLSGYYVIFGVNDDFCRELLKILSKNKKKVILVDYKFKKEIVNLYKEYQFINCNFLDNDDILSVCEELKEKQIFCIINNLNYINNEKFKDIEFEELETINKINIFIPLKIIKNLFITLIKNNSLIVNVIRDSISKDNNGIIYNSTKKYMSLWSKNLSKEIDNKVITYNYDNNISIEDEKLLNKTIKNKDEKKKEKIIKTKIISKTKKEAEELFNEINIILK